jgi:hypothetical protein
VTTRPPVRPGHGGRRRSTIRCAGLLLVLALPACGGSVTTTDRHEARYVGTRPSVLLVSPVLDAPDPRAGATDAADGRKAIDDLAVETVRVLLRRHVPARAALGPAPVHALVLDLHVAKVERGSQWQRAIVGFGLGRSALTVLATLRPAEGGAILLSFRITAGSGRDPGAATSLLGVATGGSLLLAGAGATVSGVRLSGSGTARDVAEAASVIADRLEAYFRLAGWIDWTSAPRSYLGMPVGPVPQPVAFPPAPQ